MRIPIGSLLVTVVVSACSKDKDDDKAALLVLGEPTQKIWPASNDGHDRFYSVAFDSNGNYFAAGSVADGTAKTSDAKMLVAKFTSQGELDTTYGTDGWAIHNVIVGGDGEVARDIVIDSEGKAVIAGPIEALAATDARDRDVAVVRLNLDGSLDKSFGDDGVVRLNFSPGVVNGESYIADTFGDLSLDSKGRLLVHGGQKRSEGLDTDFVLARLKTDGTLDDTFGSGGKVSLDIRNLSASPKKAFTLVDSSIIATGYMKDGTVVVPVLYKLNAAGKAMTDFGTDGIFSEAVLDDTTEVYSAELQGSSIVTVGYGRNSAQESLDFVSMRIDGTGKLDSTYGTDGVTRVDANAFNDNGRNMTSLPDGRFVLVGGGRPAETNVDGMIAVLSATGQADESFATKGNQLFDFGGSADFLWGAAVSPKNNQLVVVGIKGIGTAAGNDDAVVIRIPMTQ